jgi:hypothetical protein
MAKSRRNRKSGILNSIRKTSGAIPAVGKGLSKIGNTAISSVPVVEKGVSSVYGTLASGFDLGVKGVGSVAKGVGSVAKGVTKTRRRRRGKKSRKH